MPGTCAWLFEGPLGIDEILLEHQVPGGVRGRATGLKWMPSRKKPSRHGLVRYIEPDMIEVLDAVAHVTAGWWFLLSPAYRRKTLARWRDESGLQVMQDVVGAVGGVLVSILLPLFAWWQLRGGW